MTPFVWQDRLVKLEDGCLMFSRKGKHDDFDFCPPESDDDMALAMSLQGGIYDARPGPNGTLLMDALGGEYALSSDRWKTCFVQAVDPLQRERDRREAERMCAEIQREMDAAMSGVPRGEVEPDVVVREGL